MQFRLNSLGLFLILLFVLVFYILFSKFFRMEGLNQRDGFINFYNSGTSVSAIMIPQYSRNNQNVHKLYDNLFFDMDNGNVIEIIDSQAAPPAGSSSDSSASSASITGITVIARDSSKSTRSFTASQNTFDQVPESRYTYNDFSVSAKYSNWSYITKCTVTDTYVLFYVAWNNDTYIHVMNKTTGKNVCDFIYSFDQNSPNLFLMPAAADSSPVPFVQFSSIPDVTTSTNNRMVTVQQYTPNKPIFKMSQNVYFDVNNGNLIIQNPTNNTVDIYDRDQHKVTTFDGTTQLTNTTVPKTWSVLDNNGNYLVVYMASGLKTVIMLIEPNIQTGYNLVNAKRFDSNGVSTSTSSLTTSTSVSAAATTAPPTPSPTPTPTPTLTPTLTPTPTIATTGRYAGLDYNDYVLKTEIVPPVCPSCSTGCGGNSCATCNQGNNNPTQAPCTLTPSTDTKIVTVDEQGHVLKTVYGDIKSIGKDVYGEAKEVGGDVYGAAKEVGGDVYGAAKEVGGDVYGVAKNIGKGVYDLLSQGERTRIDPQYMDTNRYDNNNNNNNKITNTPNPSTTAEDLSRKGYYNSNDIYSNFGASQSKGGNFVPISSDFSKFGR